ncbi:cysteine-rich receptor-like protein kinase 44 isoform X2 [Malania oleifera]|uniref:cysteine-rich receptor-like protein kinase 44 isoform X2 n=1 Tax=Malania oleifera TaxID=397392 RepID=UPI0025ADA8F8|nr:cysteine-rich receptor-like protein kinase 44 isoform X2 [Malania oleifera]
MSSFTSFVLFHVSLLWLISLATAQLICYTTGNFTTNSTYGKNRNLLLSSLSHNVANAGGFYSADAGQDPDKTYALALCRGDISSEDCRNCVNVASQIIINNCTNQKEAITWSGEGPLCVVRGSDGKIFGSVATTPTRAFYNVGNIPTGSEDKFHEIWDNLTDSLVIGASMGSKELKFATGEAKVSDFFERIYALMQCTPDLLQMDCSDCLRQAVIYYRGCCRSNIAPPARFLPPPPSTNSTVTTNGKGSSISRTVVIIVSTAIASGLIALASIAFALFQMRKPKENVEDEDAVESSDSLKFSLCTVRTATNDFSDANKLGQGGFGSVYKGKLSNGQDIAVKRLAQHSARGEQEFKNEVVLLARLQHRNLVRLLGFCFEGRERLLIYEYMPNGSLDHFIFDPAKCRQLNWERRYTIICGIAQGILYLHEDSPLRIIHHDLKAGNVLLDGGMNPKIADFGMARLFLVGVSKGNTKRIAGTFGYMPPEYLKYGQFSMKTDVFSFGVLILEIISGKNNSSFHNSEHVEHMLNYVWKNWREGTFSNIEDKAMPKGSTSEVLRCIHIGLLCVQENAARRPTMASVVLMLNSHSTSLPAPSKPAFLLHNRVGAEVPLVGQNSRFTDSDQSTNPSKRISVNEASITEPYPR